MKEIELMFLKYYGLPVRVDRPIVSLVDLISYQYELIFILILRSLGQSNNSLEMIVNIIRQYVGLLQYM